MAEDHIYKLLFYNTFIAKPESVNQSLTAAIGVFHRDVPSYGDGHVLSI